ncbi:MAG TPA: Sua5/YciO/YrdC/YwlC family protein, partial [Tenuifilaceae bacterium]|nr:Sua5/YciO/YrdC/YwlC family protein [Tenuifilaceae bacterium]
FISRQKTVGIRIPNNSIPLEIVNLLGKPILTTSLKDDDELIEYTTDPEQIFENYKELVDMVIDGGYGNNIPSTIVDCTSGEAIVIRKGLGELV